MLKYSRKGSEKEREYKIFYNFSRLLLVVCQKIIIFGSYFTNLHIFRV